MNFMDVLYGVPQTKDVVEAIDFFEEINRRHERIQPIVKQWREFKANDYEFYISVLSKMLFAGGLNKDFIVAMHNVTDRKDIDAAELYRKSHRVEREEVIPLPDFLVAGVCSRENFDLIIGSEG